MDSNANKRKLSDSQETSGFRTPAPALRPRPPARRLMTAGTPMTPMFSTPSGSGLRAPRGASTAIRPPVCRLRGLASSTLAEEGSVDLARCDSVYNSYVQSLGLQLVVQKGGSRIREETSDVHLLTLHHKVHPNLEAIAETEFKLAMLALLENSQAFVNTMSSNFKDPKDMKHIFTKLKHLTANIKSKINCLQTYEVTSQNLEATTESLAKLNFESNSFSVEPSTVMRASQELVEFDKSKLNLKAKRESLQHMRDEAHNLLLRWCSSL